MGPFALQRAVPKVVLTSAQARAIASGHPWVVAPLAEGRRGLTDGVSVLMVDGHGRSLGTALASPGEAVVLRLWSREAEPLTSQSVMARTAASWRRRAPLRDGGRDSAYRLAHGEADALPGLFVDRWGDALVVEARTLAWRPWLAPVLDTLERLERPRSILFRLRPGEEGEGKVELARGKSPPEELEVLEGGLKYRIRPRELKTGLFPDERENRLWLSPRCEGKTVLNAFAFTGAFSAAALAAGAERVTSLDLSGPVLSRLRENLKLNRLERGGRHEAVKGEALSTLATWAQEKGGKRRFDVVVLDPPAYATHAGGRWRASADYPRLVSAAAKVMAPGGLLAAALTASEVSPERFEGMLKEGLRKAGRVLANLERRGPPSDFPVLPGFPEGSYLKFLAARLG